MSATHAQLNAISIVSISSRRSIIAHSDIQAQRKLQPRRAIHPRAPSQVSPRSHLLLRGGHEPKRSKVAAFLAWVCNRPRYWGAGVAPPVSGAGVTHHLPGLPLDEG